MGSHKQSQFSNINDQKEVYRQNGETALEMHPPATSTSHGLQARQTEEQEKNNPVQRRMRFTIWNEVWGSVWDLVG